MDTSNSNHLHPQATDKFDMEGEEMDISEDEDNRLVNAPRPTAGLFTDAKVDRMQMLRQKIAEDLYDTDAWQMLITEAQTRDLATSRQTFEEFFTVFPTCGRYWRYYAEQEIRAGNFDHAEKIFQRCLLQCPNVELWKGYIKYMLDHKARLPNSKEMIVKAFELAIANVGMDITSTQIWTDYINYIKNERTNSQLEESQKLDNLRKLYQRAIENPMHNLEAIWKEYDAFENSRNKTLARALLAEYSKKYMDARSTFRERKNYVEGISKNALARPPRGNPKEQHQVLLWKRLIEYEKRNPQHLDPEPLAQRVTFTYNQALLCLYHYPEIWYQHAMYQLEIGKPDQCKQVFERALKAIPNSHFIQFQYTDFLEQNGYTKEAAEVYENLVQTRPHPLIWIQYMRFARRVQGIQAARKIFFRARKQPNCTYHIYVAAALMEYYVNKDERIARNVFELGAKKFYNEPDYLMEYVNFLFHSNHQNDMRVLFEKVLATIPKERAGEVWNMFLRFESLCGDLKTISRIEARKAEAFPEQDPSGVLAKVQRYRFLDLWPCTPGELQSFYQEARAHEARTKEKEKPVEGPGMGAESKPRVQHQRHVFMPDLTQMAVFKPDLRHARQVGSGTLSQVVADFISSLPMAASWDGPLVNVDLLIQSISESNYEQLQRNQANKGDESDEEEDFDDRKPSQPGTTGPTTDLYRQRMMRKQKKPL